MALTHSARMLWSKSRYLWTNTLKDALNADRRRATWCIPVHYLLDVFGEGRASFSDFCSLAVQVLFADCGGFVDGFAFALAFSLSTKDFCFFLDGCCYLAKGGLYFEGDDCGGMAEGAYLRGGHGDDPSLKGRYKIGCVE